MADGDMTAWVRDALDEHCRLGQALADRRLVTAVAAVADLLVAAYADGATMLVFGNGGSSAGAAHLAAELVGRCSRDRRPLPAVNLGDSTVAVTSIANDYGFDQVFARQVRAFARPGDVAIGLTTSGRSANVLLGLAAARELGAVTVALCGADDEHLAPLADHCLAVPSRSTARVQEAHLLWGHMWADAVERSLDPA